MSHDSWPEGFYWLTDGGKGYIGIAFAIDDRHLLTADEPKLRTGAWAAEGDVLPVCACSSPDRRIPCEVVVNPQSSIPMLLRATEPEAPFTHVLPKVSYDTYDDGALSLRLPTDSGSEVFPARGGPRLKGGVVRLEVLARACSFSVSGTPVMDIEESGIVGVLTGAYPRPTTDFQMTTWETIAEAFPRLGLSWTTKPGRPGEQEGTSPQMPRRDDVTQLWDRGTFNAQLTTAFHEAGERAQPMSLVMVDVDHFKRVNDKYGHPKGDAVLAGISRVLESVALGKGQVYRYGGEEIVILLQNHSVQEGIAVAERARMAVESEPIEGVEITASFGFAASPDHANTPESLIEAADKALYDAKNRGRNVVRVSGEPAPTGASQPTREPERKQPDAGRLTASQREELRSAYFRGNEIHCPEDESILHVTPIDAVGSVGELIIRCPMCGLQEELRPPGR